MSRTGTLAVLDASALAEYLLGTERGEQVAEHLARLDDLHAPHLVITEIMSVIRGWNLGGHLEAARAVAACHDLVERPGMQAIEPPKDPRWSLFGHHGDHFGSLASAGDVIET